MRACETALVLLLLAGNSILASQQQPTIAAFLAQARNALDNLKYSRADSMARRVLELGNTATRVERIEALRIAAAANYPEDPKAQHRDTAIVFLRRLVRLAPDRDLRDISWEGLDSLLVDVGNNTFGASGRPARDNTLSGVTSSVTVPVTATKPAWFRLAALPESGGALIPLDSAGPLRNGALHFGVLNGDNLRLPSGNYLLRLVAIDSAAPDTITVDYSARVEAPRLSLVQIPTALDSSRLLPERTRPARARNAAIAVGLGGATALLAALLRGDHPVRDSTSVGAGYVAGAGLALGGILLGLRDRGAPIPRNVEANARLRESFELGVRAAQSQNAQGRASYRASITIDPEPRQ